MPKNTLRILYGDDKMTMIQGLSKGSNNFEAIEKFEKLNTQIDEKMIDEFNDTVDEINSKSESVSSKKGSDIYMSQQSEYAQKIKEKIQVSELKDSDYYTSMAIKVKNTIENVLNIVTEEDIKDILMDQYNPKKLSIDMLSRAINQNKSAYRMGNHEKVEDEVDVAVAAFKEKFNNLEHLKQAIRSIRENNLPINQKNLDKVMQTVQKIDEIKQPSNQTLVNLLIQNKPTTVENVYKAKYMAEKAFETQDDLKSLEPQIKKILKQANVEVTEDTIKLAKMLIQSEIPLDEAVLTKIKDIKAHLNDLDANTIINKAAANIAKGKAASDILIFEQVNNNENQTKNINAITTEAFKEITDKMQDIKTVHIEKALAQNNEIHLKALFDEASNASYNTSSNNIAQDNDVHQGPEQDLKVIKASLQLEEIRLKMTFEVANRLSAKGIDIEIEPIEDLVNHLKELEREVYAKQLAINNVEVTQENVTAIENVYDKIELIKNMPYKVYERIFNSEINFTIKALANEVRSELILEKAMKNYELLETKPRQDLGDHIEKAFKHIDSILEEMGIPITEHNNRVAKILAKNEMPLTAENFEMMKLIDLKVSKVTEKLHPSIVVDMIKNSLTPLDMHIDEVLQYMEDFKLSVGFTAEEQIENAIYELDANKTLTTEERESLIGIFRMFSTIAKSKGAAAGFLIKNNLPLDLNHLFEAAKYIRQGKGTHIKVDIDDQFGILSDVNYNGKPIKEQIEAAINQNHSVPTKSVLDVIEGLVKQGIEVEPEILRQALINGSLIDDVVDRLSTEKLREIYKQGHLNADKSHIDLLIEELSKVKVANHNVQQVKSIFDEIKGLSHLDTKTLMQLNHYGVETLLDKFVTISQLKENPFQLLKQFEAIFKDLKNLETEGIDLTRLKDMLFRQDNPMDFYEEDLGKMKDYLQEIKNELLIGASSKVNIAKNIDQAAQLIEIQKTIRAKDDYYQIPFMIGDKLSQINIYYLKDQKKHKKEESDSPMTIHMYFNTENMGKIQASIKLEKNKLDFDIYASDKGDLSLIQDFSDKIKEILSHTDFDIGKIGFDYFEGKSPINEGIKEESNKKTKKHDDSNFETII